MKWRVNFASEYIPSLSIVSPQIPPWSWFSGGMGSRNDTAVQQRAIGPAQNALTVRSLADAKHV